MKKTTYIILSAILLSILVVTGCQPQIPSPTPAPPPPVTTPVPSPAPAPSPSPTPAPQPVPITKATLNLYGTDPLTLDPAVSGDATSHSFITQIFSGLLALDDNLKPVGDIAQKWDVSNDGRTYTFYLKQGVKFQSGREVKAVDFKYSWERAADPATGSQTAATYLGDIVGVKDVVAGRTKQLSGVKVVNDYTLQVTIDAPKSYFLSKMTYPTSFVVDKDTVATGRNWWQKQPNGTGPFKLKQWTPNQSFVLERNDLFYGYVARVKTVDFHLYAGVPMNLYETGDIDVADVYSSYIYKASDPSGPFASALSVVPQLSFSYIGFNVTEPPFDDVNIRQAFSMAVDKKKLVSLVSNDTLQVASGVLPPGMPGFNKELVGLGYDVNKAKQLIAASKYGSVANLPPIVVTTSGWGGRISPDLESVIEDWRHNLGVEVTVRQLEPQRYFYNLKQEKDNMFDIGWIADYPHPQDFLEILFKSGQDNNYGEYSNPEVDALLDKANVTQDTQASFALYQQAEQKLVNDAACLPISFGKDYILTRPYVKGYKRNAQGVAMLNTVSVEAH